MAGRPDIAIVGPGRLGTALALELARAKYHVREIVTRSAGSRELARAIRAAVTTRPSARLHAQLVWFCVPDREIAKAARGLVTTTDWRGKVAFHASGALSSDELSVLRKRGAAVASVHPMMTFVQGAVPVLKGVPFGVEGDAAAVRVARRIVRDLGGEMFIVRPVNKVAYHAWGAFASPLLIAALVTAEQVARAAGLSARNARKNILPIVRQTLANYAQLGPAGAFSGPLVRGDVAIVRKHLGVLKRIPGTAEVYVALARAALRNLPVRERRKLAAILAGIRS